MFFQKKGLASHLKIIETVIVSLLNFKNSFITRSLSHVSKKSICQFKKERQYDEVVSEGPTEHWTMNVKTCLLIKY